MTTPRRPITPAGKPPDDTPREGFVAVARVLRPWGLRGDFKVDSLTDFPDERFEPGALVWLDGFAHAVEQTRWHKGALHLKLAGIDDASLAESYRGKLIEIPETELRALDEDEFYNHDLIGMQVRDATGADLGTITEVLSTGSNAVLVTRGPRGEILVPFVEDIVTAIDAEARVVTVDPIEGMLTDEAQPKPEKPPARKRGGRARPN